MRAGGGYAYGGIEAGQAKVSLNADAGILSLELDSVTKFVAGPRIGYQYPVSEKFELAAAADYLNMFGTAFNQKIHSLGLLASAAYVF
jgi:hypothetical protein